MEYFKELESYMSKLPGIRLPFGKEQTDDGLWWIKFQIDTKHPLAWKVVQELGHVVNYISLEERLPTCFYPVSPPPYMNGGPEEFLSWVIESKVTIPGKLSTLFRSNVYPPFRVSFMPRR